jgi:hypothetical protein
MSSDKLRTGGPARHRPESGEADMTMIEIILIVIAVLLGAVYLKLSDIKTLVDEGFQDIAEVHRRVYPDARERDYIAKFGPRKGD